MIVVNFNCASTLGRCLESIRAQTVRAHRVIVVDNGSSDDSAAVAAAGYPEFQFISLQYNSGFAAANNLAARMADECAWFALVNPDAFLAPDWLEQMLNAVERYPGAGCLASCLIMDGTPDLLDGAGDIVHASGLVWRRAHGQPLATEPSGEREVFSCCAAAALYRADAFLQLEGFDETFFCYVEDVDLGFRLRLAGYSCWYVPAACARHVGSASSGGKRSRFAVYHGHRNLVWCYAKNMPSILLWACLPLHLTATALTLLLFSLRGMGGVILRAKVDAIRGLPRVWRQRQVVQRARAVSAGAIWRALDKRPW
ncbi:MAG: putative glycosyltransferase [Rhodocyclales bacterium]|nr:putative glycosyltransferase [Rhodocyclales bacterium]